MAKLKKHTQETTEIRRLACLMIASCNEAREVALDTDNKSSWAFYRGKIDAYDDIVKAIDKRFSIETLKN